MTRFTKEWVDEQIEKFHNGTNDEWLTECWNNYGLALEFMNKLYDDLYMHELWHRTYKDENIELRQKINDFRSLLNKFKNEFFFIRFLARKWLGYTSIYQHIIKIYFKS